jgi:hypothetical protein
MTILKPILWSLIWIQELVLHSLGLPHLEAAQTDPMIIKHTCDACCDWIKAKVLA